MIEQNSIGEEYDAEFLPGEQTTWDDASKAWSSPGADIPWGDYANAGKWVVKTKRNLSFSESFSSRISMKEKITLSLLDYKFEAPKVVLTDVEFKDGLLDFNDFKNQANSDTPVSYYEARPFYPGEYTYKEALVGIRMRVNSLENKLGFYKAKVTVDVEDVIDRGRVEVTSTDIGSPTVVRFKRSYYNPPEELMFNITQYTTPCEVKVLEKTSTYFTIMLKSIDTGEYVTGTVSWLSTGY